MSGLPPGRRGCVLCTRSPSPKRNALINMELEGSIWQEPDNFSLLLESNVHRYRNETEIVDEWFVFDEHGNVAFQECAVG